MLGFIKCKSLEIRTKELFIHFLTISNKRLVAWRCSDKGSLNFWSMTTFTNTKPS